MLAVEECVFDEVVQEGERAHGAFKALVTESNLRCRRTRKAVAQWAMEEAQRKQEDVLRINELCKSIEKKENVKEQAEEKEYEEDDGEYYEEEDENEGWSEGDELEEEGEEDMDTTRGKTNNRPREEDNDAGPRRRSRFGRSERSRSPPGEENDNTA